MTTVRGVPATGFREVAAHSGSRAGRSRTTSRAARQSSRDAVRRSGTEVAARRDDALRAGDPVQGVAEFVAMWRCGVVDSGARAGCTVAAVAAVAAETQDPDLLAVTAEVFAAWRRLLADAFAAAGVAPVRAGRLATTVVAALEGALVLCRAERSAEPLADTGALLAQAEGEEDPRGTIGAREASEADGQAPPGDIKHR